ncbi:MAG: aminoacetone oxidase family FAD-binding enzyme [Tenericutes bacterium HGW-Tenericutes-3]|nr:MAG: aminoacetone oxidase family FAD-binding enzyme [Tenericutes bacterium HGW-Tenericutes-3]
MDRIKIGIIGGGASGIFAGIVASRNNTDVTIFEKNNRIGKKILATGNGRCNYTNINASENAYNHPSFTKDVLMQFSAQKTIEFFKELGIEPKIEDFGKAYPLSEQASSIVDVFLYELERLNIDVKTDAYVKEITKKGNQFVITLADGKTYQSDKVILATGGKAMPSTGSDGLGYPIARKFGHHISTIFPALVKLKLDSPYLKSLNGVKISSTVQLLNNNQVIQEETGDILFASYGISGPTILDLSRKANELLNNKETPIINVKLLNQMTKEEVYKRFEKAIDKPVDFSLVGLINKRIIPALIKNAGIEKNNTLVCDLSKIEKEILIDSLFNWYFKISGSKGFEDAQVTAGGIDIHEINQYTLESKIVPGLYFTGEVIDIDGICGGYNLQWAWSSGYVAAKNATK